VMNLPEPIEVSLYDFARAFRFGDNPVFNFRILPPKFKSLQKPTPDELAALKETGEKVPYFAWLRDQLAPYGVKFSPFNQDLALNVLADPKHAALKRIEKTNAGEDSRAVYFVVNQGGQKKENISQITAFFIEFDDIPLEEQWAKVMALPIIPHIVVKTKASLHCYWLAAEATTAAEWEAVQRTFIVFANSDPSISDLPRVMRVPGYDHTTFDFETGQVARVSVTCLKFHTEVRLTAAQMLAMLADAGQAEVSRAEFEAWREARNSKNKERAKARRASKRNGATIEKLYTGEPPAELAQRYSDICAQLAMTGPAGDSQRATCPCCEDPSPSFIIRLTADKILMTCHAGCTFAEMCVAIGIEQEDCFAQGKSGGQGGEESAAQILINLALANSALFHDAGGNCYASIIVNDHRETHKLGSREYKDWLARLLYQTERRSAGNDAIEQAISFLRATARYDAEEIETHVRVAEHEGAIYVDLCSKDWRQVKIHEDDWEIIESNDSPIRFRRAGGMLSLPEPTRGGELRELRELLNLPPRADDSWTLILGWLVAAFKPCNTAKFPYPVLTIYGEQGSAKTTTARTVRRVIDPNKADLRATPKDERDLAIAAEHGRVLAFDNLTRLSDSLSNALCRLATGGGFATRELYTDEGEVIFDSQRPVILNGISEVVAKSDLLDRSILIYLPRIEPKNRKQERVIERDFLKAQPRILGALLTALSKGIKRLNAGVELEELPRMADFAEWATACEEGLGLGKGQFLKAYIANEKSANEVAIEASLVAQELIPFLASVRNWKGTTGGLLKILNDRLVAKQENPAKKHGWPTSARGLKPKLEEIAPNLRRNDYTIEFGERGRDGYPISLAVPKDLPAATAPGKEGKDVHNVHNVHTGNEGNNLDDERCREHRESVQVEMFTPEATASDGEHRGNGIASDVHTNVHPVNGANKEPVNIVNVVNVDSPLPGPRKQVRI